MPLVSCEIFTDRAVFPKKNPRKILLIAKGHVWVTQYYMKQALLYMYKKIKISGTNMHVYRECNTFRVINGFLVHKFSFCVNKGWEDKYFTRPYNCTVPLFCPCNAQVIDVKVIQEWASFKLKNKLYTSMVRFHWDFIIISHLCIFIIAKSEQCDLFLELFTCVCLYVPKSTE